MLFRSRSAFNFSSTYNMMYWWARRSRHLWSRSDLVLGVMQTLARRGAFQWGSRMSCFHCAATSGVSLNEWLLVVTCTKSSRKRMSRSAKSCVMVGKSFIWRRWWCLTRLKQKHDPSMPIFWACRAIMCVMADFPFPVCL